MWRIRPSLGTGDSRGCAIDGTGNRSGRAGPIIEREPRAEPIDDHGQPEFEPGLEVLCLYDSGGGQQDGKTPRGCRRCHGRVELAPSSITGGRRLGLDGVADHERAQCEDGLEGIPGGEADIDQ
jgi:hypothetical protein